MLSRAATLPVRLASAAAARRSVSSAAEAVSPTWQRRRAFLRLRVAHSADARPPPAQAEAHGAQCLPQREWRSNGRVCRVGDAPQVRRSGRDQVPWRSRSVGALLAHRTLRSLTTAVRRNAVAEHHQVRKSSGLFDVGHMVQSTYALSPYLDCLLVKIHADCPSPTALPVQALSRSSRVSCPLRCRPSPSRAKRPTSHSERLSASSSTTREASSTTV